jgi:hypothetical protein
VSHYITELKFVKSKNLPRLSGRGKHGALLTDTGQRLKRERDEKDVGTVVPIRYHLKPFDTFRCHLKPDPYTDQQWHVILANGQRDEQERETRLGVQCKQ